MLFDFFYNFFVCLFNLYLKIFRKNNIINVTTNKKILKKNKILNN